MPEQSNISDFTTGIDEAGRGPLAGPVVAASVSWPKSVEPHRWITDSKKLTPKRREEAFSFILAHALDVSYFASGPAYIDKVNIRQATLHAMYKSFELLKYQSKTHIIIDGNDVPTQLQAYGAKSLVKGDSLIDAISCASIVAKVIRDRMMDYYHQMYPMYQFDKHKGYGTKAHYEALKVHGASQLHRRSFKLIS